MAWKSLLEMLSHSASDDSPSQYPGKTNVMTKIPLLPKEKVPYPGKPMSREGMPAMWRLEQKSVFWMGILVRKSGKAYDFVMDFCAGTCSTSKPFMLLEQHRNFVGVMVDPKVLSTAKADHVIMFVSQVLNQM